MSKPKGSVGRRGFLKGAAAGAAGFAAAPVGLAQQPEPRATGDARGVVEVTGNEKPGSDFMVDVLKTLGIEYCAANPGSSFRGLQESCINYGGNKNPEWLTCCHEESAAAMAHGYAKIEGKPMMIMVHGNVGLQHASMAIYNATPTASPVHRPGQHPRCEFPPQQRGVGAQRPGRGVDGARLRQMGRHARLAGTLRRIRRARLQDRDDAALRAGRHRGRWHAAGRAGRGQEPADPEARAERASTGRFRCRSRGGQDARRRRESRDRRRTRRSHAKGHRTAGRSWRKRSRRPSRISACG